MKGRVIYDPAFIFFKNDKLLLNLFRGPRYEWSTKWKVHRQDAFETETLNRSIIFEERKKSHAEATHLYGIGGHVGFQFDRDGPQRRRKEN
jgi:hypothetical protein